MDRPLVGGKRVFGIENQDLHIVEREFGRLPFVIAMAPPPVLGRRLDLVAPTPLRRHVERLHRVDIEGGDGAAAAAL